MVYLSSIFRYVASKVEYTAAVTVERYRQGQPVDQQLFVTALKHFFNDKLTFLHWNKGGEEMAPIVGAQGGTLLVRKLPVLDPSQVFVGDVVVLKDPLNSEEYLVRRLAAMEGSEMVSTDKKEKPFVLEKNQCWVVADNEKIKPKEEVKDSRLFGPVSMSNILGRVIYSLRSAVDHGPVENSHFSTAKDHAILEFELDVEEMAKNHKAE